MVTEPLRWNVQLYDATPLSFRPIQDRIICRKIDGEVTRASGLVIPISAQAKDEALVVAAGAGRLLADGTRRPMSVVAGDTVIFPETRGQHIIVDEVAYIALNEEHLLAKIDEFGHLLPLNDIVIARQEPTERRIGAIFIPSVADDRDEATAIACGPGRIRDDGTLQATSIVAGDRILYNKRMADHFRFNDGELIAIREEFIVCVEGERDE